MPDESDIARDLAIPKAPPRRKAPPPPPRMTLANMLLLVLIVVLAGILRFYQIDAYSLWMDEIWSIEIAAGRGMAHVQLPVGVIRHDQPDILSLSGALPWQSVWSGTSDYTNPPLYPLLLRGWMTFFGQSPFAIRSLSALLSLLCVLLFFDIGRMLHGSTMALLGAAIITVSLAQIEFAQQARAYAMLVFWCLCATDAVVRIEKKGAGFGRVFSLTVFLVAGAVTHYFFALVALALGFYGLVALRGKNRGWTVFAFAFALAIFGGIWGRELYRQVYELPSGGPSFLFSHDPFHQQVTLYNLIKVPGLLLIDVIPRDIAGNGAAIFGGVLVLLAVFVYVLPIARAIWRRDTLLWIIWLLASVGTLTAVDLTRHTVFLEYPRYAIIASPAIYALLATFNWPPRPVLRHTPALAALALAAVFTGQRLVAHAQPREDWEKLTRTLDTKANPDDLVVFYGDGPWLSPGIWYLGLRYYVPETHRPWLILNGPADPTLMQQINSRKIVWLVGRFPERDGASLLPGWDSYQQITTTAGAFCRMRRLGPTTR